AAHHKRVENQAQGVLGQPGTIVGKLHVNFAVLTARLLSRLGRKGDATSRRQADSFVLEQQLKKPIEFGLVRGQSRQRFRNVVLDVNISRRKVRFEPFQNVGGQGPQLHLV